jgi:hypothetical protein
MCGSLLLVAAEVLHLLLEATARRQTGAEGCLHGHKSVMPTVAVVALLGPTKQWVDPGRVHVEVEVVVDPTTSSSRITILQHAIVCGGNGTHNRYTQRAAATQSAASRQCLVRAQGQGQGQAAKAVVPAAAATRAIIAGNPRADTAPKEATATAMAAREAAMAAERTTK